MSLFPLISEPDTGELTGSDGLPLYREVDWDFRTNKPVWKGGNPVYVTGGAPFWCGRGMRCTPCASTTTCSAPTTALTEIPCWGRHIPERCGNLRPSALYGKRCRSIRISRTVTQVSVSFEGSVLHLSFKLTTIYGEVTIDDCDIAL